MKTHLQDYEESGKYVSTKGKQYTSSNWPKEMHIQKLLNKEFKIVSHAHIY